MKINKFALIGAAGYIAPKHLKAIKEVNGDLVAAIDKNDSVGIIDSYYPEASFFTEFERFERHLDKLKRNQDKIDYISICSPNYLHDAHIRFGLKYGSDVICEKPIVLNPWNIDSLEEMERETGKKAYSILQLRLHPEIIKFKKEVEESPDDKIFDFDLTYQTSRGKWYYTSWKGDEAKSGGIATNIGVHFFDMLAWIFGDVLKNDVHIHTHDRAAGYIEFKKARIRWFLSINYDTIPSEVKELGKRTYRSFNVNGKEIEFSDGFTDLHTKSYEQILKGEGFRISESKVAVEIVHQIRNSKPIGLVGNYHPMALLPLSSHPFKK